MDARDFAIPKRLCWTENLSGLKGVPLKQQDLIKQVGQYAACSEAGQPTANHHRPRSPGSGGWWGAGSWGTNRVRCLQQLMGPHIDARHLMDIGRGSPATELVDTFELKEWHALFDAVPFCTP